MVVPVDLPPRPPHPGFWMAAAWCVGFLLLTQILPPMPLAVWYAVFEAGRISQGGTAPEDLRSMQDRAADTLLVPSVAVTGVAGFAMALLVLRFMAGADWTRKVGLRRPSLAHFVLVLLMSPSIMVLGNFVFTELKEFLPGTKELLERLLPGLGVEIPDVEQMVEKFRSLPTALAVFLIGVGPGITEELWCRGFLGRGLVARYGVVAGVILTSFFFGAIHVDPRQGAYAMVMGLVLHFVYLATRSLWMPMLLHFINNATAVIHDKIPGLDLVLPYLDIPNSRMLSSACLLLAAGGWALFESRPRLRHAVSGEEIPWGPEFPGVEHPHPESDLLVEHPRPQIVSWGLALGAFAVFAWALYRTSVEPRPVAEPKVTSIAQLYGR